jgi:heme/copper-type cytochrome/quinol oxidase subunit 2
MLEIFKDKISTPNAVKPYIIIMCIVIMLLNYFLFIYKRKYREIIKKYKKESEKSRKIGNSIVIIYVIFTLASIFF